MTLNRTIAPEVFPIGKLSMPELSTRTLPNGAELHVIDRGEDEVNRLTILIPGGFCEAESVAVAKLAASTCLEGTANATANEIADLLAFNGSWAGFSTLPHYHSPSVYSLNSRFSEVLPTIRDLVVCPSFPDHAVEVFREKAALNAELSEKKVSWLARKALMDTVAGNSAFFNSMPGAGDIRQVTPEMLRLWHQRSFTTKGMHIFLAGRITGQIESLVGDTFGAIEGAAMPLSRVETVIAPDVSRREVTVERGDSLQTAVACAIPTISFRHPDYCALKLAVTVLGGYFGSRLMLNIREDKGYTYGIGAALEADGNSGLITVSTECDNAYTPAVIQEIRAELERMKDPASYTPAELDRARSFIEMTMAAQLDSPFAVADYYIGIIAGGDTPARYALMQQAMDEMTPESLADVARRYFDADNLYTVLAGNPALK